MRDNQTLEMQTGALRNTSKGLEGVVVRLRKEVEELQTRMRQHEQEHLESSEPLPRGKVQEGVRAFPGVGLWRRLVALIFHGSTTGRR